MKKKIIEKRVLYLDDLRNLCIKNNWYTCGTCKEYQNMLNMCSNNIKTRDIVKIAQNIMEHSNEEEQERGLTGFCFEIARVVTSLFEEVEESDSTEIANDILRNLDL